MNSQSEQDQLVQKEMNRLREAYKNRAPAPEKGHVEIFMVHDEAYYQIYLDGQHVEDTADKYSPINTYPLSRSWRREIASQAGVAEDDLRFSCSRPCFHAFEEGLEIEDLTYEIMVQWRGEYPSTFDFYAIDLDALEDMAQSGHF